MPPQALRYSSKFARRLYVKLAPKIWESVVARLYNDPIDTEFISLVFRFDRRQYVLNLYLGIPKLPSDEWLKVRFYFVKAREMELF